MLRTLLARSSSWVVPPGASIGPIGVTTPVATGSSVGTFKVKH